jgi:PleD family two-component response regulator
MRILAVDDSEDGRDITEAMLLAGGYDTVTTLGSADAAYRFLGISGETAQQSSEIDLILLDIVMPEIDGIDACASIRNDPRYADVPIIMMTSHSDTESLANAFIAGANDYIIKPLNRVELMARVRSALKLKSELDRRKAREQELLQRVSTLGSRKTTQRIDGNTGLFLAEVAEAYLASVTRSPPIHETSVVALAIDRLDAYRSTHGEARAAGIVAQVALAIRAITATVGVVAGIYPDGVIVLIVPGVPHSQTMTLAEALRACVVKLRVANPEALNASHFTASVAVVTARDRTSIDPAGLLTRALSTLKRVAAAGGNRVEPEYV